MNARWRIRILGCGSSGGVPRVGNDWGDCDPRNPRNRRTRCSILVQYQEPERLRPTSVLVDLSPDLRCQLLDASVERLDAVLMTHHHADQSHGIDDLRALVIRQRKRIPIFMDDPTAAVLGTRFEYCFQGTHAYPSIFELRRSLMAGARGRIEGPGGALEFLALDQDHGSCRSLGFRFGPIAYCNDVVALPDNSIAALEGIDTLIVDALRYAPHPTHANVAQALEWIKRIQPKRAFLTNMHVDLDYEKLSAELPPGVEPAFDGLEVDDG